MTHLVYVLETKAGDDPTVNAITCQRVEGGVGITVPDAHCFHIIVDSSESLRESHRDRKQIQIKITVENQTHFQLPNCPRSEKRKLHFICANAQNHNEQGNGQKRIK